MPKSFVQKHFPVLLVATNAHAARFWSVNEKEAVELEYIEEQTPEEKKGFFWSSGRRLFLKRLRTPWDEKIVDEQKDEHILPHMRTVGDKIDVLWHAQNYRHIIVCVPEEMKDRIASQIDVHLHKNTVHFIYGDYVYNTDQKNMRMLVEQALHFHS